MKNWGVEYPTQSEGFKEKAKTTCLKNWGVEHSFKSQEIRKKSKKTCLEKYGVEYPSQSQEVQLKNKQTSLKNWGTEHPSQCEINKEQHKQTSLKNWGVEYPSQNETIKNKKKITSLINYGVEYPMQNAEHSEKVSKNSYKSKDYILLSGNIIKIQGYENFVLDDLFQNENILEEDIITSRTQVPKIWYLDSFGKKHRYYVDIFIPSQNRMIECKSTWTMKKGIEKKNVYLKQQACKDAGYLCEIWVYNAKGEKVECIL